MKKEPQTVQDLIARLDTASREEFLSLEKALAADTRITLQKALARARRRIEKEDAELRRIEGLYAFDRARSSGVILGLDEVGRGPLAGPLAVGGVVLPDTPLIGGINDSKKVLPAQREALAREIKEHALAWTVCYVEPAYIDSHGMTQSLYKAFQEAIANIEKQGIVPDCILLDGNPLRLDSREVNIIKGDAQSAHIGAASILAKVARDELMVEYARQYPQYHFDQNKGYASLEHREAIGRFGLCPIHRKSFCGAFLQETLF